MTAFIAGDDSDTLRDSFRNVERIKANSLTLSGQDRGTSDDSQDTVQNQRVAHFL